MVERLDRPELSTAQRAALAFAEATARARDGAALERLTVILRTAGCEPDLLERTMASIRSHASIALHFHPDRYGDRPATVAESLLTDGRYRNQFVTGLSSGSRTAFAGGSRDRWERELFGGCYHEAGVVAEERPKYGSLELIRYADGPAPRFGSCYFVLRRDVAQRATFTFGGSERPAAIERFGTIDCFSSVIAPLLDEVASGGFTPVAWPPFRAPTLGVTGLDLRGFLARLMSELAAPRSDPGTAPPGRVLDSGVEAHVHGSIELHRDVERLVADPSFDGTPTGEVLTEVCRRYGIQLQWHGGFVMPVSDVPDDFRGPEMRPLAQRISSDGTITAAVIGAAEASLHQRPEDWRDRGTKDETLQHLKQLWHVLVHHGAPFRAEARRSS